MEKYKPYLKKLDYPNIHIANDQQVTEIFSSENRYFLIKWFTNSLNPEFVVPLDLSESSAVLLANFFYESGFCTSSQKLSFVKGDKKLTIKEQIKIFDRILYVLDSKLDKENVKPKIISRTEDLEPFIFHKDVNVFPKLRTLKACSVVEREQKFKSYKDDIEKFNININALDSGVQNIRNDNLKYSNELYVRQNEKKIDLFKEEVVKLKNIAINIEMNKNIKELEKKPCFQPGIGNQLIECNSKMESVAQYFQNMNLIKHLNDKQPEEERNLEENEVYKILKQKTDISFDVLEMSKQIA